MLNKVFCPMVAAVFLATGASMAAQSPKSAGRAIHGPSTSRSDALAEKLQQRKQKQMEAKNAGTSRSEAMSAEGKAAILSEAERGRERQNRLLIRAQSLKSRAEIDTLNGLSEEDKNFLRRRYAILHPMD